jgi:hypothetical protein
MDIDGSLVSCLGIHLKSILQILETQTHECVWFIADVDAHQVIDSLTYKLQEPQAFGDTRKLINLSENVDQFLSGVFLAVPVQQVPNHWVNSFSTERPPFDEMESAVFEIRAFDTTFIEVFTIEKELLLGLADKFGVEILCS